MMKYIAGPFGGVTGYILQKPWPWMDLHHSCHMEHAGMEWSFHSHIQLGYPSLVHCNARNGMGGLWCMVLGSMAYFLDWVALDFMVVCCLVAFMAH